MAFWITAGLSWLVWTLSVSASTAESWYCSPDDADQCVGIDKHGVDSCGDLGDDADPLCDPCERWAPPPSPRPCKVVSVSETSTVNIEFLGVRVSACFRPTNYRTRQCTTVRVMSVQQKLKPIYINTASAPHGTGPKFQAPQMTVLGAYDILPVGGHFSPFHGPLN